jgi:primosomal protein N' (replication factor Y)
VAKQATLFELPPDPLPWELAADADRVVAGVVLARPMETVYHYLVPEPLREIIKPGQRVRVPLGAGDSPTLGYCVEVGTTAPTSRRLKSVLEILDRDPLIGPEMLALTKWIGERYLASWGQVLETVIPAGVKKQSGTREIVCYVPAEGLSEKVLSTRLSKKQRAVVDVLLASTEPLAVDELAMKADCGTGPIQWLRERQLIVPMKRRMSTWEDEDVGPVNPQTDLVLNEDQQKAVNQILSLVRKKEHQTVLLHGITGSGKTEVYIQTIREIVSYGKQAIVLVPEISLTPQTIRRFRSRFDSVAVLHSHLTDSERHAQWQRIAAGGVQVVVGARSAIFAPTPQLGLIIIDEEHETTFKQQTTPRYHAREVARERARLAGVPLILGSATPTLESLVRTRQKKDLLISMPRRVEGRPLPPVSIVDVRNDPHVQRGEAIGRALMNSVTQCVRDGGQAILFLNLRGYSPVLWCQKCGVGVRCPDCDLTLTWHADRQKVVCHSCDYEAAKPAVCPNCQFPGLKYLGTGTQRLEQELAAKFKGMRLLRMDSDSMKAPGSHDEALERFRRHEVDILLGTQMIAKGLDFPNVTLVGVVAADTLLHQPDLRASERTFQLIAQVAGRTGRGEKGGRVIVQTSCPDEPVIQRAAKHDYLGFAAGELRHRQELKAPPFTHLARIILRGEHETQVNEEARRITLLYREAAKAQNRPVRILGPAPAPLTRLRKMFRFHFQLSAESLDEIHALWREVQPKIDVHPNVEMTIDVDPLDMR